MAARYNPPPNWPDPPSGWTPPPGWEPDPAWGPPPYGWKLWIEDAPTRPSAYRRHLVVALGFVIGVATLLGYVYFFSAPDDSVTAADPDVPHHQGKDDRRAKEQGSTSGSDGSMSHQDPAPYTVTPNTPPPTPTAPVPPRGVGNADSQAEAPASSAPSSGERRGGSDRERRPRWPRGGDLDPRYPSCAQAKAAGYGPYHLGRDAEYFWYADADRDGVVCT